MSNDMTGETVESILKNQISISFELCENRSYDSFFLQLCYWGAGERLPGLGIVRSSLTVDEIKRDLEVHIDTADRLIVAQVTSMSCRNLINDDKFERGAA
jgi:hypothetical protein